MTKNSPSFSGPYEKKATPLLEFGNAFLVDLYFHRVNKPQKREKKKQLRTAYNFVGANLLTMKKSSKLFDVNPGLRHLVRITVVVLR